MISININHERKMNALYTQVSGEEEIQTIETITKYLLPFRTWR